MEKSAGSTVGADRRLFEAFVDLFLNINRLQTFYLTTKDLLTMGTAHVEENTIKAAKVELAKPEWRQFVSIEALDEMPGLTDFVLRSVAGRSIRISKQAIDSAALVFAHTILDATLTECCLVTFYAAPSDWFSFVEKRKVELADLQNSSADDLRHQKALEYVKQLSRESMVKRLETLHMVCVPKLKGEKPFTRWILTEELEKFDRLRHDVIHVRGFAQPIPDVQEEVLFALVFGVSALALVGKAYGLTAEGLLNREQTDIKTLFTKVFGGLTNELPEVEQYLQEMTTMVQLLKQCLEKIKR
jgi:hypothetical protein